MPFKGDMRLGGPHDNERSLNGTSSDFESVPAYGTLLSGPSDTSRWEGDFVGNQFFMPYSTSVYANGLGGSYSVETWGLQYYPAGWVTGTTTSILDQSWAFTAACDNTQSTSGSAPYLQENYRFVEDGTGINTQTLFDTTPLRTHGEVIASYNDGNTDRWRVVWDAVNQSWAFEDFTCYPTYGTILNYVGGDLYATTDTCGDLVVGSYSGTEQADGYGASFQNVSNSYSPYGTYLGVCGTMPNWDAWYYSNGNGGMYTDYPPSGFELSNTSFGSSFTWNAPDGTSGSYTYANGYEIVTATGGGNTSTNSGGWSAQMYEVFQSGTYSYDTGNVDENNEPIYATGNYNLKYDGNGGYITETWT